MRSGQKFPRLINIVLSHLPTSHRSLPDVQSLSLYCDGTQLVARCACSTGLPSGDLRDILSLFESAVVSRVATLDLACNDGPRRGFRHLDHAFCRDARIQDRTAHGLCSACHDEFAWSAKSRPTMTPTVPAMVSLWRPLSLSLEPLA